MAVIRPEADRPAGLSGGADAWDDGLAGGLLSADYFAAAAGGGTATIRHWSGSAWVSKPLKRWNGTAWENVPAGRLKRWNGSAWVAA